MMNNFQGKEGDTIVASLTRNNNEGDIGFIAPLERRSVLITRRHNCIVPIRNMENFNGE